MYFCKKLHESIKSLCSSGMQQQQPGTVTHSRISSLLISRRLTRSRVASSMRGIQFGRLRDRKWAWRAKTFRLRFAHQWSSPPCWISKSATEDVRHTKAACELHTTLANHAIRLSKLVEGKSIYALKKILYSARCSVDFSWGPRKFLVHVSWDIFCCK